jgi:hypothetical protein
MPSAVPDTIAGTATTNGIATITVAAAPTIEKARTTIRTHEAPTADRRATIMLRVTPMPLQIKATARDQTNIEANGIIIRHAAPTTLPLRAIIPTRRINTVRHKVTRRPRTIIAAARKITRPATPTTLHLRANMPDRRRSTRGPIGRHPTTLADSPIKRLRPPTVSDAPNGKSLALG